ncbi:MAG TPA: hypothetical protein VGC13_05825 [Longimicrobium sp.]|jgi:hypothetical protein|uniref:hypothetical protein n=1 Tax=Longimicrobium sp. TaxID=2029185 RepID=UPI002EDBB2E2
MRLPTFRTPEEAILDWFPGIPCRVLASAREGDDAYVLVDTTPDGRPGLYGATAARQDGGWVEGTGGTAPGWTRTDAEHGLGTATVWGKTPEGAVRVRAVLGDDVREVPVANGVYLMAWWRVPAPGAVRPRVDAFRIDNRWVPARAAP